jgi:hypothetical protein
MVKTEASFFTNELGGGACLQGPSGRLAAFWARFHRSKEGDIPWKMEANLCPLSVMIGKVGGCILVVGSMMASDPTRSPTIPCCVALLSLTPLNSEKPEIRSLQGLFA